MAAGRKTTHAPAPIDAAVNGEALLSASRALSAVSADALALQQQFGLESLDPDHLEREIALWMDHTGRTLFMIGARLLALRTITPHGEWLPRLARLGMAPRTAQKMMGAALKCVDQQGRLRDKLTQLSRSKVLELITLDDAQLDELETTGRIAQLALEFDDIDKLSTTELRAKVRDLQGEVDAKARRLRSKVDEVEALKERIERPFKPSPDSEARTAEEQGLLNQMRDCVVAAETALMQLAPLAARIFEDGTFGEGAEGVARDSLVYLAQRTAAILQDSGTGVQFDELVVPAWIKQAKAKGKKA
jgi:hypothetical protein